VILLLDLYRIWYRHAGVHGLEVHECSFSEEFVQTLNNDIGGSSKWHLKVLDPRLHWF
jgi:hypothetical protein